MVIARVAHEERDGRSAFVYQTKPKDGGESAELYKDDKGMDWFSEDELEWAVRE